MPIFLIFFGSLVSKQNKKKCSSVDLSHLSPICVGAPEQCIIILICTAYNFFIYLMIASGLKNIQTSPVGIKTHISTFGKWRLILSRCSTPVLLYITYKLSPKAKVEAQTYSGPLVQWYDSRFGCERSRVQFPHGPYILLTFILCWSIKRKLRGSDFYTTTLRVLSSAVEHRIADPAVAGSIPAAPFFLSLKAGFEISRVKNLSGDMLYSPCGPIGQGV